MEGGPPTFGQGFTCPALLEDQSDPLPLRAFHPLRGTFPGPSGSIALATGLVRFRSPLLTESRLLSFPPATEMFQFAGFASRTYGFSAGYPASRVGCPIRTFRDQRVLAPPPDLSQRATSFIASWCQGIHQMPFSLLAPLPDRAGGSKTRARALAVQPRHRREAVRLRLFKAYPCFLNTERPSKGPRRDPRTPRGTAARNGLFKKRLCPHLEQTCFFTMSKDHRGPNDDDAVDAPSPHQGPLDSTASASITQTPRPLEASPKGRERRRGLRQRMPGSSAR